jgi:hypothetical protein
MLMWFLETNRTGAQVVTSSGGSGGAGARPPQQRRSARVATSGLPSRFLQTLYRSVTETPLRLTETTTLQDQHRVNGPG